MEGYRLIYDEHLFKIYERLDGKRYTYVMIDNITEKIYKSRPVARKSLDFITSEAQRTLYGYQLFKEYKGKL